MVSVPAGFACNVCQERSCFGRILSEWEGLDGVGSTVKDGDRALGVSKIRRECFLWFW